MWQKVWRAGKSLFKVLIKVAIAAVAGLTLLLAAPMLANDLELWSFSRQIFKYPLPEQTALLEKYNFCGYWGSTGNGMEFLAVMVIESELHWAELRAYYNNAGFEPVHPHDPNSGVDIDVIPTGGRPLSADYMNGNAVYFDSVVSRDDQTDLYYVAIHDGYYPFTFDLRGS